MFGVWCGKDATVAAVEDFCIAYLRIRRDVIACVLRHRSCGTVGVVYGLGTKGDAKAVCCEKHPETGELFYNEESGKEYLEKHSGDAFTVEQDGSMIYRMYDGTEFKLALAEEISMEDFDREPSVDPALPVAARMALWNMVQCFRYGDGILDAHIDTRKYSILFSFSLGKCKNVYCRVGQNGYCEKGWAMLSTTCVRLNECRMIEDNLQTLQEYRPKEECFVENSCAFPADGGWYLSLKEVTDDVIYLNGCGGDTYEIYRKK